MIFLLLSSLKMSPPAGAPGLFSFSFLNIRLHRQLRSNYIFLLVVPMKYRTRAFEIIFFILSLDVFVQSFCPRAEFKDEVKFQFEIGREFESGFWCLSVLSLISRAQVFGAAKAPCGHSIVIPHHIARFPLTRRLAAHRARADRISRVAPRSCSASSSMTPLPSRPSAAFPLRFRTFVADCPHIHLVEWFLSIGMLSKHFFCVYRTMISVL